MNDNQDDNFLQNPGEHNPAEELKDNERLPNDMDTPFSPPDGVQDRTSDTHQVTDTNIQPEERYDQGIEGAVGVDLPGQAADESDTPPKL